MIDISGTNENEFKSVSASMEDLCFDVFGSSREKKDPKDVKGHRELLDVLPGKRKLEDDGDVSEACSIDDEDGLELPSYKRCKVMEKHEYENWKSNVIKSKRQNKTCADFDKDILFSSLVVLILESYSLRTILINLFQLCTIFKASRSECNIFPFFPFFPIFKASKRNRSINVGRR